MTSSRTIVHLDLDAFFCAVEEQRDPALRGKPFAVGGSPSGRGVVASCSYPARAFGIHSAMPMAQAVRLCPELIIVSAHFGDYRVKSRQVMAKLRLLTPLVEQLSIDEAFLDVTGLAQEPAALAEQVQRSIHDDLGLPASLGVASNKLVAKIANNVGKARAGAARADHGTPNAILVIPTGMEAEFLAPLPCRELWGVGPKTAERLHELGIETIGDIARFPAAELARLFGKHGEDLTRRAQGIDDRPIVTEREAKSVSAETTFARDTDDGVELRQTIRRLARGVAKRLQQNQQVGATVKLKLRWADFTTPTRQTTLARPTHDAALIGDTAVRLFDKLWTGQPVRLLGVGVSGLDEQPYQPTLWEMETDAFRQAEAQFQKQETLRSLVRDLDERYGPGAVRRGNELDTKE